MFFAGQISGVEGYTESAASGLIAGRNAAALALGRAPERMPDETALGSLCRYISRADAANYQPTNIAFGLLPPLDPPIKARRARKEAMVARALDAIDAFKNKTAADMVPST